MSLFAPYASFTMQLSDQTKRGSFQILWKPVCCAKFWLLAYLLMLQKDGTSIRFPGGLENTNFNQTESNKKTLYTNFIITKMKTFRTLSVLATLYIVT